MKIALIRGDFANPWELQNFSSIGQDQKMTLFTGRLPISKELPSELETKSLYSPMDLNFGSISRMKMAFLNRVFSNPHMLFGLEKELKGFDIAHSAETYFYFTKQSIAAKNEGSVKFVVSTVWENIPFNNESLLGFKKTKEFCRKNIDLFLPVTIGAKKALIEEGVKEEKINVLMPGININKFIPIQKYKNEKKSKKNKSILFVGRLEEDKGAYDMVSILGPKIFNTNINLVIIGKGSLEQKIVNYVKKTRNKNIQLIREVKYEDMPAMYNKADLMIHPAFGSKTWQEQYGMVLIEAMACGTPIIAANSGAIPEILGNAGMVKDKKSIFFEALNMINNKSLLINMSLLSRKRAKAEFDKESFSKNLAGYYNNLMRRV